MKKKVLIIDSDVSLLNSLSEDIIQAGFDVAVARNAHDGLNIAHEASLIIVAVELPDQNGFVVCSSLKHNPQTTNIPVFITSSAETTAAFEPTLDYVVVKIPKWPFDKFASSKYLSIIWFASSIFSPITFISGDIVLDLSMVAFLIEVIELDFLVLVVVLIFINLSIHTVVFKLPT